MTRGPFVKTNNDIFHFFKAFRWWTAFFVCIHSLPFLIFCNFTKRFRWCQQGLILDKAKNVEWGLHFYPFIWKFLCRNQTLHRRPMFQFGRQHWVSSNVYSVKKNTSKWHIHIVWTLHFKTTFVTDIFISKSSWEFYDQYDIVRKDETMLSYLIKFILHKKILIIVHSF